MYDEPVFRPPSEAYSLIFQVTLGCSWNKCAFCEMYTSKRFTVKKEEDIFHEIDEFRPYGTGIRKVFLADGNAMALSAARLGRILDKLNTAFPKINRISAYALPGDILRKTPEELKMLREKGLKLLYVGIESGDDEVLRLVNKGESRHSTIDVLLKAKEAGIQLSVMILTGLGGRKYSIQHAINSATLLNEIQPDFASVLVLSFPFGIDRYRDRFAGEYVPMDISSLINELRSFIEHTDLNGTIFRSDHASNYLILKGVLRKDKDRFLKQIDEALEDPGNAGLRPEWARGL